MKVIIGTIKVQFSPPILGVAALLFSFWRERVGVCMTVRSLPWPVITERGRSAGYYSPANR